MQVDRERVACEGKKKKKQKWQMYAPLPIKIADGKSGSDTATDRALRAEAATKHGKNSDELSDNNDDDFLDDTLMLSKNPIKRNTTGKKPSRAENTDDGTVTYEQEVRFCFVFSFGRDFLMRENSPCPQQCIPWPQSLGEHQRTRKHECRGHCQSD